MAFPVKQGFSFVEGKCFWRHAEINVPVRCHEAVLSLLLLHLDVTRAAVRNKYGISRGPERQQLGQIAGLEFEHASVPPPHERA